MTNVTESKYFCLSLWPLDMPKGHLITWATLTGLLSLIVTASNAMLIYALYATKQLNSITNKFILLMNISDLCTGIFVLPVLAAMMIIKDSFRSCKFELAVQYWALFLAYFSFFILIAVSLDRYVHVVKLNQYNRFMNELRMKIIVVCSLVFSAIIPFITVAYATFPLQVIFNVADISGVLMMLFLYTLVFRKIRLHVENFKNMLGDVSATTANRETKRELSATKTIRFLLATILILYFPYNTASPAFAYYKFKKRVQPSLVVHISTYIAYVMVFSNSAANAIIFSLGNSSVKRFIAGKFSFLNVRVEPSELSETRTNAVRTVKSVQL